MDKVRYGVVGYGNMGSSDANLVRNEIDEGVIYAVCDTNPDKLKKAKEEHGDDLVTFDSFDEMLKCAEIDAIYIATPHYDHPSMVQKSLEAGKHVLCEKPAGVYTKQVQEMYDNIKGKYSDKIFAMMFNQRPHGAHQKIKKLIESGELGKITRINWIITNWFRTQAYYNSGGWRATWEGEGGGVLINQCPHQLDLWQWFFGLPSRVRAFCAFGKKHDIEVDDDVTAYMEYDDGCTGVFITTTGDAPGTNRLEITSTRGKLVYENDKITFYRTEEDVDDFLANNPGGFATPATWECNIPFGKGGFGHDDIHRNFCKAILGDEKLIAQGTEGINGLMLGNSMLISAWTDDWTSVPVDADKFYELLQDKIKNSTVKKDKNASTTMDLSGSSSV